MRSHQLIRPVTTTTAYEDLSQLLLAGLADHIGCCDMA